MCREIKRPRDQELSELYKLWLNGYSLRTISRDRNFTYSALLKWFREVYGSDACDPVAQSLIRSLLADVSGRTDPDSEVTRQYAYSLIGQSESIQHRSHHNLKQLSRFQVVYEPEYLDFLAVSPDPMDSLEYDEPLRLPWLPLIFGAVRMFLAQVILNTCHETSSEELSSITSSSHNGSSGLLATA